MLKRILTARETILAAAILALLVLIAVRFPAFVAPSNLIAVFNDTSPLMLLALGQMIVILTKCIDLSVAANLALTGMCVAMLNILMPGLPVAVIIVIAVALGTLMGMVNGLLVWKLDIPPIVVTLGTMTIFRGIIFLISNGKWVNAHEMSPAFKAFPRAELLGLPMMSWVAILVILAFFVLMTRTSIGRAVYAVGGNPHAAVYTGIDVGRTKFTAYTISGALAGLTGYLWVSRYAVAYVDIAGGFEHPHVHDQIIRHMNERVRCNRVSTGGIRSAQESVIDAFNDPGAVLRAGEIAPHVGNVLIFDDRILDMKGRPDTGASTSQFLDQVGSDQPRRPGDQHLFIVVKIRLPHFRPKEYRPTLSLGTPA